MNALGPFVAALCLLMLVKNGLALRRGAPTPSRLLLLAFWITLLVHAFFPAVGLFALALTLLIAALLARLFPRPAQRWADRLGLPVDRGGSPPPER